MFELYQGIVTADSGGGGLGGFLIPLVLMFIVFYFLLIRPQNKKANLHNQFLNSIKTGDKIITNGGMFGKVTGLDERTITVEVAERVRIKVLKSAIAGPQNPQTPNNADKK